MSSLSWQQHTLVHCTTRTHNYYKMTRILIVSRTINCILFLLIVQFSIFLFACPLLDIHAWCVNCVNLNMFMRFKTVFSYQFRVEVCFLRKVSAFFCPIWFAMVSFFLRFCSLFSQPNKQLPTRCGGDAFAPAPGLPGNHSKTKHLTLVYGKDLPNNTPLQTCHEINELCNQTDN